MKGASEWPPAAVKFSSLSESRREGRGKVVELQTGGTRQGGNGR